MWLRMGNLQYLTCFLVLMFRETLGNYEYYDSGYLSDLNTDWAMLGGRVHQPRCVDIPATLKLCRNIGYKQMRLPNLLDHETLSEVVDQARVWVPLLNIHCHPDTKLFLCSLYSPVCLERPIYPCRSLCEGVKRGCEERIIKYGYPWPEILRCDQFPEDSDLCIGQVNFENTANVCVPCKQPLTYESLLDSYCWAEFVIKGRIDNVTIDHNGDKRMVLRRKSKFYKAENITRREKRDMVVSLTSGSLCDCDDAIASKKKKLIMGNRQGSRFVVTFISDWSKSSKGKSGAEFKRATRAMRKGHDCRAQIQEIAGQTDANNGGISTNIEPPKPGETNIEQDIEDTLKDKKRKGDKKRKKDKKKKGKKDKDRKGKSKKKKGRKNKKDKGRKGRKNRPNNNNNSSTANPLSPA